MFPYFHEQKKNGLELWNCIFMLKALKHNATNHENMRELCCNEFKYLSRKTPQKPTEFVTTTKA